MKVAFTNAFSPDRMIRAGKSKALTPTTRLHQNLLVESSHILYATESVAYKIVCD